jgi:hypothetical protein
MQHVMHGRVLAHAWLSVAACIRHASSFKFASAMQQPSNLNVFAKTWPQSKRRKKVHKQQGIHT